MAGCPNGVFRPNSLICTTYTCRRPPTLAQTFAPRRRGVAQKLLGGEDARACAPVPRSSGAAAPLWAGGAPQLPHEEQDVGTPGPCRSRPRSDLDPTPLVPRLALLSPRWAASSYPSTALGGR